MALHPELQRLFDERAVRRVACAYARAVDARDWPAVAACYHPDARDVRRGVARGVGELLAWIEASVAGLTAMSHLITTHTTEVDGDTATSDASCLARHGRPDGDRLIVCRYRDRLERRGGVWRIAERQVDYEPVIDVAGMSRV